MLTKNDLKQIRTIVQEEVGTVDKKLSNKIDDVDKKLSNKISRVDNKFSKKIDRAEQNLSSRIDEIDKKLDKAQEDISIILTEVIQHHESLEKRVEDIENHLDLPKSQ